MNVFGDVAGVIDLLIMIFSFFVYPIVHQKFIIKIISSLFMAQTKSNDLFKAPHGKHHFPNNIESLKLNSLKPTDVAIIKSIEANLPSIMIKEL